MKLKVKVDESQCVACGNCYQLFQRLGGNFPHEIVVDEERVRAVGNFLNVTVEGCFLEALKVEEIL
jgi:hypothetical protein